MQLLWIFKLILPVIKSKIRGQEMSGDKETLGKLNTKKFFMLWINEMENNF